MTVPPLYLPLHQGAVAAVRETLDHLPTVYLSLASMFRAVCAEPEAHWPHPVFVLDDDEILEGADLSEARLAGWEFVARVGDQPAYVIEVQGGVNGKDCRFAGLTHGPFVDSFCQKFEDESLQDLLSTGRMQLATLVVSDLGLQAVWFRAAQPTQGLLFVLQEISDLLWPRPAGYTVPQFEDALRKEVRRTRGIV